MRDEEIERKKEEILAEYYTRVSDSEFKCNRCGSRVHVGETLHGQEEFLLHETQHELEQ